MILQQHQKHLRGQLPEERFFLPPECDSKPAVRCPRRTLWERDKRRSIRDTLVGRKQYELSIIWHFVFKSSLCMPGQMKVEGRQTRRLLQTVASSETVSAQTRAPPTLGFPTAHGVDWEIDVHCTLFQ